MRGNGAVPTWAATADLQIASAQPNSFCTDAPRARYEVLPALTAWFCHGCVQRSGEERRNMNSRILIITVTAAALAATGLMAKETAPGQHRAGNRLDRMSTMLNLTAQEKERAKSIFAEEREAAKPVREQLNAERKAVQDAIESHHSDAEIRQLAKNEAPTLGDLAAIRASGFARFYAELTPEQQQKLATMHHNWQPRKSAAPTEGNATVRHAAEGHRAGRHGAGPGALPVVFCQAG